MMVCDEIPFTHHTHKDVGALVITIGMTLDPSPNFYLSLSLSLSLFKLIILLHDSAFLMFPLRFKELGIVNVKLEANLQIYFI
jgi:hypothetical protein